MTKWFRRLFGIDCCGEWSRWEQKSGEFSRAPRNIDEMITALSTDDRRYHFSRDWQERHCEACGKVQQELLGY